MKNKYGKIFPVWLPENVDLDGQSEVREPATNGWLKQAMGFDRKTQVSQTRSIASELFLQTQLFPLIKSHETVNEAELIRLLVDFRKSEAGLHMGFEMAHVMARMLNRFQCYLLDDADDVPAATDPLTQEIELFEALTKLDFKRIDEEVWNRLYSG